MRTVAKVRKRWVPGRVVAVPLGDGTCGYGRVLADLSCTFFDVNRPCGEGIDLEWLVAQPAAFTVGVMASAFSRSSGWHLLDVVVPTEDERSEVHRWGKRDPISGRFSVYYTGPGGYEREEPAEREQVVELEVAAAWSATHIEDRLRSHFRATPDKWSESMKRDW
jgi:hypothetical protein